MEEAAQRNSREHNCIISTSSDRMVVNLSSCLAMAHQAQKEVDEAKERAELESSGPEMQALLARCKAIAISSPSAASPISPSDPAMRALEVMCVDLLLPWVNMPKDVISYFEVFIENLNQRIQGCEE